jgi:hypothetical protein
MARGQTCYSFKPAPDTLKRGCPRRRLARLRLGEAGTTSRSRIFDSRCNFISHWFSPPVQTWIRVSRITPHEAEVCVHFLSQAGEPVCLPESDVNPARRLAAGRGKA